MSNVKINVTRFALSTATAGNTQDVTISGFGTVKAAIFILNQASTDDTIANGFYYSIGYTDGTNQAARGIASQNNATSANTGRTASDAAVICAPVNAGSGNDVEFAFSTFITDGVRLSITTASSSARLCSLILIGGSDVTAHVGGVGLGTGTSAIDVNTVGFLPSVVFMSSISKSDTAAASSGSSISIGAGINDGSDTQRFLTVFDQDGTGTSTCAAYIGNASIVGSVTNSGLVWDAAISSYDASGFSITPSASASSSTVIYLCLKIDNSPDVYLGDMSWPTSGNYAETNPGFQPEFGFISSVMGPTARNTNTTSNIFGLSHAMFDTGAIYTNNSTVDDGETITITRSLSSDQLRILSQDGSTDSVLASSYAFDSLGWDFTLTTNPATDPVLGWALAIGAGASATFHAGWALGSNSVLGGMNP